MNNEDINPNYKGRFLKNIVADYELKSLEIDEGTVLVQETEGLNVYFQLGSNYPYRNEWEDERRMFVRRTTNDPMEMLPGSAVDSAGRFVPDSQKFCLAQCVRFPADGEVAWYEKQGCV